MNGPNKLNIWLLESMLLRRKLSNILEQEVPTFGQSKSYLKEFNGW